jgi:general secretion pathway protein N
MNALASSQTVDNSKRETRGFPWRWPVIGVLAYLLFLLLTFPAVRLSNRLQANGIVAAGLSGTVWNGSAAAIQLNGMTLGPTQWNISPWRLLTGKLSVDIHAKRDDGYFDGTVRAGFGDRLSVYKLRGSLPINALASMGLPGGGPGGWGGVLQVNLDEATLVKRWPTRLKGTIEVVNLVGPPQQPTQLGTYRVSFPASGSSADGELQGAVQSMEDSPLDVVGVIKLTTNRQYVIDAQVATRPSASAAIVKTLQYLGPPDARGRRPLSLAGSL